DGELPVAGGFRLDLEVDHGPGQADRSGHLGESGVDGVAHGNTELFAERTDLRGGAPVESVAAFMQGSRTLVARATLQEDRDRARERRGEMIERESDVVATDLGARH